MFICIVYNIGGLPLCFSENFKRIEKVKAPFVIVCQYLIPEIKTMGLDAGSPDIRRAKSPA